MADARRAALKELTRVNREAQIRMVGRGERYEVTAQHVCGRDLQGFACVGDGKEYASLNRWYKQSFDAMSEGMVLCVDHEDQETTFTAAHDQVCALAAGLIRTFGLSKGDRVSVAMRNLPEWCLSFLATTALGAIAVPTNSWWSASEMAYGLADSGSSLLVCDAQRLARAAPALIELGVPAVLVRGEGAALPATSGLRVLAFDAVLRSGQGSAWPPPASSDGIDDDAVIMYTSGTTGNPKGVVQTQRNLLSQMAMSTMQKAAREEAFAAVGVPARAAQACSLCPVPLFHVTACVHLFLSAFVSQAKLVLMTRWDAGRALQLIERHAVNLWVGVPTMVQDVMEHADFGRRDTSSLQFIASGGAATPPPQVAKLAERFPATLPANSWGMTETAGAGCQIAGLDYAARPASCGRLYPIVEAAIVDEESGEERGGGGAPGELLVRSPLVMSRYWGKPTATAEAIVSLAGRGAGWLRTGDVATLDADGFLTIVDRKKDIIIRGGENISCCEVEGAFFAHPAVMECAAFGLPHPRLGEVVGLVVLRKADAQSAATPAAALLASARERLAAFKVPSEDAVYFTDAPLPRGATGKTLKRELRETYAKVYAARSKL